MGREDYQAQVIRNLESDKGNLIDLLVEKCWCPWSAGIANVKAEECKIGCSYAPEDCWAEHIENKRSPETYCTR